MLFRAPPYIYYPILIVWSAVYGAIGGAFYKLLAVYENWKAINHYHVLLWKKYPQRSYRKYIFNMWTSQIRGKPIELAEYTKLQIERQHPAEPFPFLKIVINTLLMIVITPFMMCLGILRGPLYVYRKGRSRRLSETS